jgi:hypothetical protein
LHIAQGANGKDVMQSHWDTWITEEDWASIQAQGFNTVRIPVSIMESDAILLLSLLLVCQIGYYHLSGIEPKVLDDTDFEKYKDTFYDAWSRILHAIGNAERYGLGVMIGEYFRSKTKFHFPSAISLLPSTSPVCISLERAFLTKRIDLHAAPGAQNKDAREL